MKIKQLTQFLKILADESRIRILLLLKNNRLSVNEICSALNMNQPAVSKHLVKLRLLNIVHDERDGNFIYYSINENNPEVMKLLNYIFDEYRDIPTFVEDSKKLEDEILS
jgi:ArsR family transcriptional regulator, arsenate/arsenite/antimonite-responsive transcriptional repressor